MLFDSTHIALLRPIHTNARTHACTHPASYAYDDTSTRTCTQQHPYMVRMIHYALQHTRTRTDRNAAAAVTAAFGWRPRCAFGALRSYGPVCVCVCVCVALCVCIFNAVISADGSFCLCERAGVHACANMAVWVTCSSVRVCVLMHHSFHPLRPPQTASVIMSGAYTHV